MRSLSATLATIIAGLTLAIAAQSADAARLGGDKNLSAQRPITQQQSAPSQRQAAPTQAQPAGAGRWLGPLAGMAAGLGLGWLFANGGMGAMFGSILMGLALLFIGMTVMRMLSRSRAPNGAGESACSPYDPYGGGPGAQYSGLGNETVAAPPPSQMPGNDFPSRPGRAPGGGAATEVQQAAVPPGFDVTGFLKLARLNFIRLQEANDHHDYDALRDVTTDDLYDSLAADLRTRGSAVQHTDVVTLDTTLLEVVTENNAHRASVKFSGQVRDRPGAAPSSFAEVWHLSKPATGGPGWLIDGIEQIS